MTAGSQRMGRSAALALAVAALLLASTCVAATGEPANNGEVHVGADGAADAAPNDGTTAGTGEKSITTEGEAFMKWLTENGVDVSGLGLLVTNVGLSLIAREDLPAGHTVFVPDNVVLNHVTASQQSPTLVSILDDAAEAGLELPANFATTLSLMYEAFYSPASFWRPYIALMPIKSVHPSYYTEAELAIAGAMPAFGERVMTMRRNLLKNFGVMQEVVFSKHPDVFGDAEEEGVIDMWQGQYAWADALVLARGILGQTSAGDTVMSLVPLLDITRNGAAERPDVLPEASETGGVSYTHVVAEDMPRGTVFATTSDSGRERCNIDALLYSGHIANATSWDCVYVWEVLPDLDRTPGSLSGLQWNLLRQLGLVTEEAQAEGGGKVEVLHRNGDQLAPDYLVLARILALDDDNSLADVRRAGAGEIVSLDNERRALHHIAKVLLHAQTETNDALASVIDSHMLPADEVEWPISTQLVASSVLGALRALESGIMAARQHWAQLLAQGFDMAEAGHESASEAGDLASDSTSASPESPAPHTDEAAPAEPTPEPLQIETPTLVDDDGQE